MHADDHHRLALMCAALRTAAWAPTSLAGGSVTSPRCRYPTCLARSTRSATHSMNSTATGTPFPHQVPAAVAAFGPGRLLYGSDYCWTPAHAVDAQLASIDQADQPADDSWRAHHPQRHPATASLPVAAFHANRPRPSSTPCRTAGSQVIPLKPKTTAQSLAGWKTVTADWD